MRHPQNMADLMTCRLQAPVKKRLFIRIHHIDAHLPVVKSAALLRRRRLLSCLSIVVRVTDERFLLHFASSIIIIIVVLGLQLIMIMLVKRVLFRIKIVL